jgi:transposase
MKKLVRLSPEVRQRAVAMYAEVRPQHSSDWSAMSSIAAKIGCSTESLLRWIIQSKGIGASKLTTPKVEGDRLAQLERENRELRRANEILKLASAFFAQAELDRKLK